MSLRAQPADTGNASPPRQPARKGLLRFVACGSVDHGKSTLIGRLLYESKQLFEDQLDALAADSRKFGTQGEDLDFSLLVDGLAAEREQKITIDVAYRFFATARRKFIVIDSPGHEQYTANMATGASNADVALVLVGADDGLTRQTRRHLAILAMLGLRDVVLAVNKMDRASWAEQRFRAIESEFAAFASGFGIDRTVCIPLAAKSGDNVVTRSPHMGWYRGPTLRDYLEEVEPRRSGTKPAFRMPVQYVSRPNEDFRGYSGLIAAGEVTAGMAVTLLPSGRTTQVARIATFDGDLYRAAAGRAVTLTFTDEVDASRGDLAAATGDLPAVTERLKARLFWMNVAPLVPGRHYLIKLATATASAVLEPDLEVFDLETGQAAAAPALAHNAIGVGTLRLNRPIAADRYADCRETGSFIVIDPESYDTVGMGCVETVEASSSSAVPAPAGAADGDRAWRQSISWQIAGSLVTFAIALAVTGSLPVSAVIAVAEASARIGLRPLHDQVWRWIEA
jgi:sulfate adenylyltransferase large subunit